MTTRVVRNAIGVTSIRHTSIVSREPITKERKDSHKILDDKEEKLDNVTITFNSKGCCSKLLFKSGREFAEATCKKKNVRAKNCNIRDCKLKENRS